MEEPKALEFTQEERQLLVAGLRAVRLTGTIEHLPQGIKQIMDLIKKIQSADNQTK